MARRVINPEKEIKNIVDEIKKYFIENGNDKTKAVIGISGGKDSTIAAALLARALGPHRILGVLMPQGVQRDITDSIEVCKILNIPYITVDIGSTCSSLYSAIDVGYDYDHCCKDNPAVATNTPARMRMATLYAVAAMAGGRVINTGNASELYVGYTTKYGDLAGDFAILRDYYVREVCAIGDALEELPERLVHKDPGDGMSGKTDEDNMGFSYETLDNYLLDGVVPDYETLRNIEERHKRNKHKNYIHIPYIREVTRHWDSPETPCPAFDLEF